MEVFDATTYFARDAAFDLSLESGRRERGLTMLERLAAVRVQTEGASVDLRGSRLDEAYKFRLELCLGPFIGGARGLNTFVWGGKIDAGCHSRPPLLFDKRETSDDILSWHAF
ncbi:hypothetical protein AB7M49_000928 [Bradyrhizobium elkanii]|jgi:hypothetical protein|nr:hypothetical protein [Bradyrhizobium elkanii]MCS4111627.1 hypothetical protein [Bradyrhizobium elkanii]MCW2124081.1 hypothetical protein [Bradyrhizobium elkanii]MCW2170828.1 hypothetical protein [Bradyrhizobium elkanii]MDH6688918.1 hypothetical protein [Bradyrhizobium elkanii]OIM89348.1 hypothetical protein BLN97_39820 [Bradyrhizobium elkanii]